MAGRVWVDASYNTNCLYVPHQYVPLAVMLPLTCKLYRFACAPGLFLSNGTCAACNASLACAPGLRLTPCSRYADANCNAPCANASMPPENAEYGEACAWRCLQGSQLVVKRFLDWVEYYCDSGS